MSDRPHRQQWKHATVLGRRKMRRDHRKGWSSIHLSVPCMKMATRQDLLNRGANANAVNNANDTPLCVVARGTSTDCQIIVGALVDRNANPCPFCGIGVDLPYVSANLQIVRDVSKRWTGSLFPNACGWILGDWEQGRSSQRLPHSVRPMHLLCRTGRANERYPMHSCFFLFFSETHTLNSPRHPDDDHFFG